MTGTGNRVERPITSGDSPRDILRACFGHREFRDRQAEIVERTIAGEHSLVLMPTGMGKSVCFQIPALLLAARKVNEKHRGLTLVISPLIALMKDQVDGLVRRGIEATFINSSLDRNQRESRQADLSAGRFDLLYVTPERFRKPEFLEMLRCRRVHLLAVDEAHCISHWGHDFRPDYTRLREIRSELGDPVTIALTATATPQVQSDIISQLGLTSGSMRIFNAGIERPNLTLRVSRVWGDEEKLAGIRETIEACPGSGIVYFSLIRTLERFSEQLTAAGTGHLVYHGDLPRERRRQLQNAFMQGRDSLVLATNAFGMGIDKEDIRFVVHAEIPGSMEAWYQEIGRAGRDDLPAECHLLYDENDLEIQLEFLRWSNPDAGFYSRLHHLLSSRREETNAYGREWLERQLLGKRRADHRLDTALAMLDRHGVVEGAIRPLRIDGVGPLPPRLASPQWLDEKRQQDQEKLLALVRYVNHRGDRRKFINDYFGVLPEGGE